MDNTIIRVTKAQKLEAIKEFIPADATVTFPGNENKTSYVFDSKEMIAFIDAELALLAKKNSGDKKQTADQKANENYKMAICDFLAELEITDEKPGATCTEMFKAIPCMADYSSQKVSALCRQLKTEGKVYSKLVKGKTYFFLL